MHSNDRDFDKGNTLAVNDPSGYLELILEMARPVAYKVPHQRSGLETTYSY
jgi:hypothetical protein